MIHIHQDELNAIIMMPDGSHGVTVQLVSYVKRMIPNSKKILEEHNSMKVEHTENIVVRTGGIHSEIDKNFKGNLAAAISRCQQQLALLQQNRLHIEGALKDYVR